MLQHTSQTLQQKLDIEIRPDINVAARYRLMLIDKFLDFTGEFGFVFEILWTERRDRNNFIRARAVINNARFYRRVVANNFSGEKKNQAKRKIYPEFSLFGEIILALAGVKSQHRPFSQKQTDGFCNQRQQRTLGRFPIDVHVHEKSLRAIFQHFPCVIQTVVHRNKFITLPAAVFVRIQHHAGMAGALEISFQHFNAHRPTGAGRRIRPNLQNAFRRPHVTRKLRLAVWIIWLDCTGHH
ncbi:MAG: hypothetical protein ALAOOOJD_03998 [bacterium]|nr:hypothetical protein [bacterium]